MNGVVQEVLGKDFMFKDWEFSPNPKAEIEKQKKYKLEIHFSKETFIKGFHTAWNVGELSFGLDENDEPCTITDSTGMFWRKFQNTVMIVVYIYIIL